MVTNTKEVIEKDINVERSSDEEKRELSYKDEICVGCGICENICPVGAIELGSTGAIIRTDADVSKITIDENKCVLCGMCSVACPADALDFKIDDESIKEMEEYPHLVKSAEIDDETCVFCKA